MKQIILILIILPLVACAQTSDKTMKNIISKYEYKTHFVNLDTIEVGYVKEGKGVKTLLFIHGLSSNADAWSKNINTLKENFTCIALDLPGYGKSEKPINASYTSSYFAKIISAFIDELELKNVILVGHSMGGQAAIKLAVSSPERIERLILVAPAGIEMFSDAHGAIIKTMFTPTFVINTNNEQIKNNYALNFYKKPEGVNKMIEDRIAIKNASDFEAHALAISKSIAGMLDDPVTTDLAKISQKTLVLYGENDMLIPNRYFHPDLDIFKVGNKAKELIKYCKLAFVEESGHFLQFEQSEKVNFLIKEFIEKD